MKLVQHFQSSFVDITVCRPAATELQGSEATPRNPRPVHHREEWNLQVGDEHLLPRILFADKASIDSERRYAEPAPDDPSEFTKGTGGMKVPRCSDAMRVSSLLVAAEPN